MREGYGARPEQAILFTVSAWDVNCPQHIPQRFAHSRIAARGVALGMARIDVSSLLWNATWPRT